RLAGTGAFAADEVHPAAAVGNHGVFRLRPAAKPHMREHLLVRRGGHDLADLAADVLRKVTVVGAEHEMLVRIAPHEPGGETLRDNLGLSELRADAHADPQ